MPLYTFNCKPCELYHDELAKMDSIIAHCPNCGMESERVLTTPAVIMRPAGYREDPDSPTYFSSIPTEHNHYSWQDNRKKTR